MRIYREGLSDVTRYIDSRRGLRLEEKEPEYQALMTYLSRFKTIDETTKILEIGTGTGWFPILCKKNGIPCKGLEISPQLVEYGREFGRRCGLEPDIKLGNVEDTDLGTSEYDVVIASSVFEHVEYWQKGIDNVFRALKPGGVLYFCSTNKFSIRSGEYAFPLYGWLPDKWRYALRTRRQGADIMKLGIDFHQFTYPQLRRYFKKVGFSQVLDLVELLNPNYLHNPRRWKKVVLRVLKGFPPLRHSVLLFSHMTTFVCIK